MLPLEAILPDRDATWHVLPVERMPFGDSGSAECDAQLPTGPRKHACA
jgi:hypothetical protein